MTKAFINLHPVITKYFTGSLKDKKLAASEIHFNDKLFEFAGLD